MHLFDFYLKSISLGGEEKMSKGGKLVRARQDLFFFFFLRGVEPGHSFFSFLVKGKHVFLSGQRFNFSRMRLVELPAMK